MKIAIITHVCHIKNENQFFGYAPYIREINIWIKYADEVIVVSPLIESKINAIEEPYLHEEIDLLKVPSVDITSVGNMFRTISHLPTIFLKVFVAMKQADHIHLRCPGNMGLIGAMVQILFPKKKKTAKYAGNWDPNSNQPWSYRLQKWILSNTFLTKNIKVLVYGEWPNQTKNIKSFFTATYTEIEAQNSKFDNPKILPVQNIIKFIFVGTLSSGKQPLYAVKIIEKLYLSGKNVCLDLYGEGVLRKELEQYIEANSLQELVCLKGNQSKDNIEKVYRESHFLILASKSEGWPKVVAEAMFWGCVPLVTPVSCVSYMIDNGNRGLLLLEELDQDVKKVNEIIENDFKYKMMSNNGMNWSRQFTIDKFEEEIKKLLR